MIISGSTLDVIRLSLSDKGFPPCGRTIASVNIAVTVQAGPGKHLVRWGRSLKSLKPGGRGAGVPHMIVAIAAKLGHPIAQEFVVIAAVGNMAS
jgi:hypothetical protein